MKYYFIFSNDVALTVGFVLTLFVLTSLTIIVFWWFVSSCISGLKFGFFNKESIEKQAVYETLNILMQSNDENMLNAFSTSKIKKTWAKILVVFFAFWMTLVPLYDMFFKDVYPSPSWFTYF